MEIRASDSRLRFSLQGDWASTQKVYTVKKEKTALFGLVICVNQQKYKEL